MWYSSWSWAERTARVERGKEFGLSETIKNNLRLYELRKTSCGGLSLTADVLVGRLRQVKPFGCSCTCFFAVGTDVYRSYLLSPRNDDITINGMSNVRLAHAPSTFV